MIAVRATGLGKRYRGLDPHRASSIGEAVARGFRRSRAVPRDTPWSLQGVDLEVQRGTALGVVGRNGAGKSTLLRLIGGVLVPDEGSIRVEGRVGGLLELTAGFHADLTGRENVQMVGVVRGLTSAQVRKRFDAIVTFAELGSVIDRPIRTYSTGMQMRLAFAISVHAEPDVLLVDEVLAVGDAGFQSKCMERLREMKAGGMSILLVSHDTGLVQRMCDQVLWLERGRVREQGTPTTVLPDYLREMEHGRGGMPLQVPALVTSQGVVLQMERNRFGDGAVTFSDVRIRTSSDPHGLLLGPGDSLTVEMDFLHPDRTAVPLFAVSLNHDDGRTLLTSSLDPYKLALGNRQPKQIAVRWTNVHLEPGTYFLDVAAFGSNGARVHDRHVRSYPVVVRQGPVVLPRHHPDVAAPRAEWFDVPGNEQVR